MVIRGYPQRSSVVIRGHLAVHHGHLMGHLIELPSMPKNASTAERRA